jgi:hypothetical protein
VIVEQNAKKIILGELLGRAMPLRIILARYCTQLTDIPIYISPSPKDAVLLQSEV